MAPLRLWALAWTVLPVAWPSGASATSCVNWDDDESLYEAAPGLVPNESTRSEIPTNTAVWIPESPTGSWEPDDFTLVGPDGLAVPWEEGGRVGGVILMQPEFDLQIGLTYSVEVDMLDSEGETFTTSSFTVELPSDDVPPSIPQEVARLLSTEANEFSGLCGSGPPDDVAAFTVVGGGSWQLGAIRRGGAGDWPEGGFVTVDAISDGADLEFTSQLPPGTSFEARFAAFDLAGNFSGWSESVKGTMPPAGCSCREDGRGDAAWVLLGGLGLARPRRRRAQGVPTLGCPADSTRLSLR